MSRRRGCKFGLALFAALAVAASPSITRANPYLARPGETPLTVRAATCAISGGFIHLYAALDFALFDKYGIKMEFISIRGSGVSLAALAESIYFVEKNPDKAKASVSKALKLNDAEALQSAYDAYARLLVNRRMVVPENTVAGVVEVAREQGTNVKRKAAEIIDNRFVENLEKSGFLKELWGAELPR